MLQRKLEKKKPKGLVSFQHLKDRLEGKSVKLDVKKFDTYDRALCVVYIDNENINAEMVKQHLAEIYSPANHNDGIEE
jgi:micrococcal nuclease